MRDCLRRLATTDGVLYGNDEEKRCLCLTRNEAVNMMAYICNNSYGLS